MNEDKKERATVGDIASIFRGATYSPLLTGLAAGGLVWGGSRLLYPWLTGVAQHLYKRMGTTPYEQAELDRELHAPDSKFKKWAPLALGGVTTAAFLASHFNPNHGFKSLYKPWGTVFDPKIDSVTPAEGHSKGASIKLSLSKAASDLFNWDINDQTYTDFGKMIPIRMAKDIIMNDPNAELYHKGNALSIINDAAKGRNFGNVSAGNLFDSALNTVQRNLTLSGITSAAVRGTVGYGMAKAFTNTIGSLVGMPKALRNGIVDAGMITSIITGLD